MLLYARPVVRLWRTNERSKKEIDQSWQCSPTFAKTSPTISITLFGVPPVLAAFLDLPTI
jgi:hypothetical protein